MLGITQQLHLAQSGLGTKLIHDDGTRSSRTETIQDRNPTTQALKPLATAEAVAGPAPANPSDAEKKHRHESGGDKRGHDGASDSQKPRTKLIKMLGVNYRWSPIVVDDRDRERTGENGEAGKLSAYGIENPRAGDVRSGDRGPDAPVRSLSGTQGEGGDDARQTTLFKLFSPPNTPRLSSSPPAPSMRSNPRCKKRSIRSVTLQIPSTALPSSILARQLLQSLLAP